jgi:predicted DNA binding CopG/RHH family protein
MRNGRNEKESMIHVRFTEDERRKLKAKCALLGITMQEYIRDVVLRCMASEAGKVKK